MVSSSRTDDIYLVNALEGHLNVSKGIARAKSAKSQEIKWQEDGQGARCDGGSIGAYTGVTVSGCCKNHETKAYE